MQILNGKWKLAILCAMRDQPVRLSQLTRIYPSASKKVLRASLRSLENIEVVVRCDMSGTALHVEYDLADDMRSSILAILDGMAKWGDTIAGKEARRQKAKTDA